MLGIKIAMTSHQKLSYQYVDICLKERAATEDYGVTFGILVACACGNYAANIAPRDMQFAPFCR